MALLQHFGRSRRIARGEPKLTFTSMRLNSNSFGGRAFRPERVCDVSCSKRSLYPACATSVFLWTGNGNLVRWKKGLDLMTLREGLLYYKKPIVTAFNSELGLVR